MRPIRLLAASAAALGQGLPPQPIASTVREINQVGDVLVAAAESAGLDPVRARAVLAAD